jgi:hypothetical protein
MTPKEKAIELFDKFMKPVDGLHKYPMCFDTAKQCALIAVDMVIECCRQYDELNETFVTQINHWQEVKQELEKL